MAQKKEDFSLLSSSDENIVLSEIDRIKEIGTKDAILPLLEALKNTDNPQISMAIEVLLADMKNSQAIDQFLENYLKPEFASIRAKTFSAIWNSSYIDKCKTHLAQLADIACSSDYLVALESLTLIENLEGPYDEALLLEAISLCKAHLKNQQDNPNKVLISELINVLSRMDNENSEIGQDDF